MRRRTQPATSRAPDVRIVSSRHCDKLHALVDTGRGVLVAPTYPLVQTLLAARRDLLLPKALRTLDVFDAVILDDLGYVQQTAVREAPPVRQKKPPTPCCRVGGCPRNDRRTTSPSGSARMRRWASLGQVSRVRAPGCRRWPESGPCP